MDAAVVDFDCAQKKIIHGDALSASIAAASILAKVHRDAIVRAWDAVYPQYGLASNKGYSTPQHKRALREHGPSPMHRQSYAPVAAASEGLAMWISILWTRKVNAKAALCHRASR